MTEREVAAMFLRAFEHDSINAWIRAVKSWSERDSCITDGPIHRAVGSLRAAWYHDGSDEARNRCKTAAEHLRRALKG